MKFIIASDIHGSSYYMRKLMDIINSYSPEFVLLLGDLLYHGPRNDLPRDYAPKEVISMLNSISDSVLCVRGNCEAEVDQMVLDFPCMADYAVIKCGERMIYATHGHTFTEDAPPKLHSGNILLTGHTHIPKCVEHDNFIYMNPGSVSIPKNGSWHGYMTYDNGRFAWMDFDGEEHMSYEL
jgi:hypothetical protein